LRGLCGARFTQAQPVGIRPPVKSTRIKPVNFPVLTWPVRIYYEDTDASGVVYHAAYLRFFERARTEWLRSLGFSQERLRAELNVAFAVAQITIEFRRPAHLDDALEVTAELARLGGASLDFVQRLRDPARAPAVLAQARARIACVDAQRFRPRPVPEILTAALRGERAPRETSA
jgi:acyl-CoA thioester hydrolase